MMASKVYTAITVFHGSRKVLFWVIMRRGTSNEQLVTNRINPLALVVFLCSLKSMVRELNLSVEAAI